MKVIIKNRINNLPDETTESIDINLTGFIADLWETPETERSKFSSFIHKPKSLDADKINGILTLSQYGTPKSIDAKKTYGKRLHSVTLKSNLTWETLEIDEKSYLKHRNQSAAFLPNLIQKHGKTKSVLTPASVPDFMMESPLPTTKKLLRTEKEVNPAYPAPPVLSEPVAEPSTSEAPTTRVTSKAQPNNTKKNITIFLLSLIFGIGLGVGLTLLNFSLSACLFYGALASTTSFIVGKQASNKRPQPSISDSLVDSESEEEIESMNEIEEIEPVSPLSSPPSQTKIEENKKNIRIMPPKPILKSKTLSKQASTVLELSEDSGVSSEEISPKTPKRAANHSRT